MESQGRRLRADAERTPGTAEALTLALRDVPGVVGGSIEENVCDVSHAGLPPYSIRVNVMVEAHADFRSICDAIRANVPAGCGLVGSYDDGHGGRFEPWGRMANGMARL